MPNDLTLRTDCVATKPTSGHWAATDVVHGVLNRIYKATVAATRTVSFTVGQALSGETVPVSSASPVTITAPALDKGTVVEFVRTGPGTVAFSPLGVSFVMPADEEPEIRAEGASATLLWLTSTQVLVAGGLIRG